MNRSSLIEKICSVVLSESEFSNSQKSSAKKLLENLSQRRITEDEAERQYNLIIETSTGGYWIHKYKSKVVYESLKKYLSGNLNWIGICKMISSIITHSFIELEITEDKNLDHDKLGIIELIKLLEEVTLSGGINEEVKSSIDSTLIKYGYINQEGGDQ